MNSTERVAPMRSEIVPYPKLGTRWLAENITLLPHSEVSFEDRSYERDQVLKITVVGRP